MRKGEFLVQLRPAVEQAVAGTGPAADGRQQLDFWFESAENHDSRSKATFTKTLRRRRAPQLLEMGDALLAHELAHVLNRLHQPAPVLRVALMKPWKEMPIGPPR